MSLQARGTWFAVLSALGFGSMAIFASFSYKAGATVETVLVWRFFLATVLLWGIVWWRKYPVKIGWVPAIQSILLGIIGYAVMSLCYFTALKYISMSLNALLLYLYPVYVAILSLLLGHEKWENRKGAALAASIAGMALLIGVSAETPNWVGVILAITAGVVYCIFILASRRIGAQINVLTMTAFTVTGAFFCLLLIGIGKGSFQLHIGTTALVSIAAMSLLSTVLAITLTNASIQLIGATKVSIISTLEPMFTIALAYLFFHETMTEVQMAGAGLILFALVLLQLPSRQALPVPPLNSATYSEY